MKCYGNVKGWVYRTQQPVVEQNKSLEHVVCPRCRKVRRERDFWDGNTRRKSCINCRIAQRDIQAKSRERK